MSLPEISRRCLVCGASVRGGARFCPQCGAKFDDDAPPATTGVDTIVELPAAATTRGDGEAHTDTDLLFEEEWREFESVIKKPVTEESQKVVAENAQGAVREPEREAARTSEPPPLNEEAALPSPVAVGVAAKGARAAANVREGLRPRVEKVRETSMGVLEEASEDSGLRFVLVAVALFLVFLFLLFLSTVIK
ncbi:MAG: zinc ribbon domain-containing protein [Acidobacteria bacterium]|nr:zinc ribbon domain-containing protein [Acidobacteriota bacterium]